MDNIIDISKKETEHFDTMYYICKNVLNINDPRTHISHFKVLEGKIIATDGRVLVIGETALSDGYYTPVKTLQKGITLVKADRSIGVMFPPYEQITDMDYGDVLLFTVQDCPIDHLTGVFCAITGIPINDTYARLAHKLGTNRAYAINNKNAVRFTGNGVKMYIMPVMMPENYRY